jgi:Fuc2NAc and GlcNAc transferase
LTWLIIQFAGRRQLLDIPNERSSHDLPVPRGGGIAVILSFTTGMAFVSYLGMLDTQLLSAVSVGAVLLGLIGVADDYRDIPPAWRLLVHALVAGWALYSLDGISGELLPGVPPILRNLLGLVSTIWLINLFNFMDGIDGIAGIETITVCIGGIILRIYGDSEASAWIPYAILLAGVAGFLFWNYPPARLFLGDSGSGFLGFMMAVFCVQAAHEERLLFWAWIILLAAFIADSGVTLARRLGRREPLHVAHRRHAYQFASRKYGAHAPVSLAVGAINLVWLLPLALLVASRRMSVLPALLIAYAPLIWLAIHFKAGACEEQDA